MHNYAQLYHIILLKWAVKIFLRVFTKAAGLKNKKFINKLTLKGRQMIEKWKFLSFFVSRNLHIFICVFLEKKIASKFWSNILHLSLSSRDCFRFSFLASSIPPTCHSSSSSSPSSGNLEPRRYLKLLNNQLLRFRLIGCVTINEGFCFTMENKMRTTTRVCRKLIVSSLKH